MRYLLNLKTDKILKNSAMFGRIFIILNLNGAVKIFLFCIKYKVNHIKHREKPKNIYEKTASTIKFLSNHSQTTKPTKKQTP